MELRELFEALGTIDNFDATNLDSNDLIDLLRHSGYRDVETEQAISQAEDDGRLVYAGYYGYLDSSYHKYVFAWFDNDYGNKEWNAVALLVNLNRDGKVRCEFAGSPIHTFDEEDEIDKYFKRIKISRKI